MGKKFATMTKFTSFRSKPINKYSVWQENAVYYFSEASQQPGILNP